ncbi:MAG: hypothetical protein JO267_13805 [Alphaproteobacteria bacterium]|nr:hypothetical protein [Alphaproteobacteria bacterium]
MAIDRGIRRRTRKWHVGEKAVIDHLVRGGAGEKPHAEGRVHPAFTASGLLVEEQVRKAGNRSQFGLAIF